MKIIYYEDELPETFNKSLFLAGPSLRPNQEGESWRKNALQILNDIGFDGIVFVPENKDGKFNEDHNYEATVEWEEKCLNIADCILFWIPRDISVDENGKIKLPGFTTNVEFGAWCESGKMVFGCPENSDKNTYLKYYAEKYKVPIGDSLIETLENAIDKIGNGSERLGGERFVPLMIWNLDSFQSWYKAQTEAGNRLDSAKLLYNFRPRFKNFVFLWILKVKIYIAEEDRFKENEFVLSRPDISSVLMWKKNSNLEDSEVVIIKEFRSPASTEDSFIRELPSGSSNKKDENKKTVAALEVFEETGYYLDPKRLTFIDSRQLMGTLSAHKSHLYSVELTEEDIKWFKSQDGVVHGNEKDTERTFIEVVTVKELLNNSLLDWSTLGMILSIINGL